MQVEKNSISYALLIKIFNYYLKKYILKVTQSPYYYVGMT